MVMTRLLGAERQLDLNFMDGTDGLNDEWMDGTAILNSLGHLSQK
jgi:hypothetical protein